MTENQLDKQDLQDRLSMIESMIAEGRQTTESWGWTFVLWGLAYSVAIVLSNLGAPLAAWTTWGHRTIAWPLSMCGAGVVMWIVISRMSRKEEKVPETTMGRAIASLWITMGISMVTLLTAAGFGGRMDQQSFVAIVCAMLGFANGASSLILKWRTQFQCACVWWIASAAVCFTSLPQTMLIFLGAIFLCQIVFGSYMMISESRGQKPGRSRPAIIGTGEDEGANHA